MLDILNCNLCPRNCHVNRMTEKGFCGMNGQLIRVGRASLHMWEEPCISGDNGSGTVFFSGCNLKCVYCQNRELSQENAGIDITISKLAECMLNLQKDGAHNINLVTPTHYAPQIIEACDIAQNNGMILPIIYNTSGYEMVQTIQALNRTISVFLTDFKYYDDDLAMRYSMVPDYFEIADQALRQMIVQTGKPRFDANGMIVSGVIVRHLILPGHQNDSRKVLKYLHEEYGDNIIISIMNQYTPLLKLPYENLNRKVTEREYDRLIDYALSIGIQNAFIQEEGTQQESFIPLFNGEGII